MQVKSEPQILNRCFTCLCHPEDCFRISSDVIGSDSLTVVDVLTKYFWFQQNEFTKAQHVICVNCWNRLDDFHRFYREVEENHRGLNGKLSETFEHPNDVNCIVQIHSEIEIKEEEGENQSGGGVESDYEGNTASSSDETNETTNESRSSGRVLRAKQTIQEGKDPDESINAQRQYNCMVCEKHFATSKELKVHTGAVHKKQDVVPEVSFDTKTVRRHKQEVQVTEEERKYHCKQCPMRFVSAPVLKDHMKQHKIDKTCNESTTCPHCNKRFGSVKAKQRHIIDQHDREQISCDVCKKKFAWRWNLERHMDQHKSLEDQRVQCRVCKKWLKNKNSLSMHALMHTAPKKCDICGLELQHRLALMTHKTKKHRKNKRSNTQSKK